MSIEEIEDVEKKERLTGLPCSILQSGRFRPGCDVRVHFVTPLSFPVPHDGVQTTLSIVYIEGTVVRDMAPDSIVLSNARYYSNSFMMNINGSFYHEGDGSVRIPYEAKFLVCGLGNGYLRMHNNKTDD